MNQLSQSAIDSDLEGSLRKNEHTLIVMDAEEFIDFIARQKSRSGISRDKISEWMDSVVM